MKSLESFGKFYGGTELDPPVILFADQLVFEEVLDELSGREEAGRVGHDNDVDQDGEQVVCSRRAPDFGVLEETDEDSTALRYTVYLPSR